jgi:plasmid replication initiation protein
MVLFMSNEMIVKSNYLIEASYKLNLNEQRLVLCAVSKIKREGIPPLTIAITAQEFGKMFPDIGENRAYDELKKATDSLFHRYISVKDPECTTDFHWIQKKVKYHAGAGRVTLEFSNEIQKYLCQLQKFFTRYPVKAISNLTSIYSIRLYELVKQFETLQKREISIEEFKSYLGIVNSYKQFRDLKKRVLTPAINELNKKSPLTISVDLLKEQRRVIALQFTWKEKDS